MPLKKEIQDRYNIAQAKTDKWKKIHEGLAKTKDHLPTSVVMAVEEILINQVKFVTDMQRLNNMLIILRDHVVAHGHDDKKSQLAVLNNYLSKLDGLLKTYAALPDPLESINSEGQGAAPEELIEKLCARLNQPELKKLMTQLGDLADEQMKVNDIYRAYQQDLLNLSTYNQERTSDIVLNNGEWSSQARQISDFTIMPAQNLPRIYMPIEELQNKLASFQSKEPDYHLAANQKPTKSNPVLQRLITLADTGVASAKKNVHEYNNKIKAAQIAVEEFNKFPTEMKIKHKQAGMLRNILDLNMNTPLQKENLATTMFFTEYLKTALVKAYPQMFRLDIKGNVDIILPASDSAYANIHKALGYDLHKLHLTGSATLKIDPEKFDAQTLDTLYQESQNPLWLVLKSTKPISQNFTAEQKIQAYVELAQAFKNKQIGTTGKYLAAYNIAQAALAVAQAHPQQSTKFTEEFGPESTLGKWIISKAKTKDDKNQIKDGLTFSSVKQEANDEPPSFTATTTTHDSLTSSQNSQSDVDVFTSDDESSQGEYADEERVDMALETFIEQAPLSVAPVIPKVAVTAKESSDKEQIKAEQANTVIEPIIVQASISAKKITAVTETLAADTSILDAEQAMEQQIISETPTAKVESPTTAAKSPGTEDATAQQGPVEPSPEQPSTRTNFKAEIANIKHQEQVPAQEKTAEVSKPIKDTQALLKGKQSYLLAHGLHSISVSTQQSRNDLNKLKEQIKEAKTHEELLPLEDKVIAIAKITQAVNTVSASLRTRKNF